MKTDAIFGDLKVKTDFYYERNGRWTRCRKISSPERILGEGFEGMNLVLLGGECGLVDCVPLETPVKVIGKKK